MRKDKEKSLPILKLISGALMVSFAIILKRKRDKIKNSDNDSPIYSTSKSFMAEDDTKKITWGYDIENGPDVWAELSPDFSAARYGKMQSPINITENETENSEDKVKINYKSMDFEVEDNGHTINFNPKESTNNIEFNNETYNLKNIHFHSNSENTLNLNSFDMEAHIVHKNDKGDILVVGVFINEGKKHNEIGDVFKKDKSVFKFNPLDLLPKENTFFTFLGSLTTPPCTENVRWIMFKDCIQINKEQLEIFRAKYNNNFRKVQELNGRKIYVSNNVII